MTSFLRQMLPTSTDWTNARPFPHVVVDGWLWPHLAAEAAAEFPDPDDRGKVHRFSGPLEGGKMEASADVCGPMVAAIHDQLASDEFVGWLRAVTGIADLVADPERLGAGVHMMSAGARLAMHTDFSRHPSSGLCRRVNAIVYLNDEWLVKWGGATALSHNDIQPGEAPVHVYPRPGRLIVFASAEGCWHGVPVPLTCPEGVVRMTIPQYFYSPCTEDDGPARSTTFREQT